MQKQGGGAEEATGISKRQREAVLNLINTHTLRYIAIETNLSMFQVKAVLRQSGYEITTIATRGGKVYGY